MVQYAQNLDGVLAEHLSGFFAGWPNPPSPETHLRILRQSSHVVFAREPSRQVVGFIAAISDGVLSAFVSLLEVLPSHRRNGIGIALVRQLLAQLQGLYSISLHCDPDLRSFYERLGMRPLCGMAIRNYSVQAGRHAA
jgi:ribosomal protein S18 acetylase RimI-like enzyme